MMGNKRGLSIDGRRKLIFAVVVMGILVAALLNINSNRNDRVESPTSPAPPLASPVAEEVEGRYLFNGTVFWGRRIEQWSTRADGSLNYAYPFSGLSTFEREAYDAWVGELECPSSSTVVPLQRQETELVFNCRPEFLPEAAKYFNFINLANNHTDNLGAEGLEETRANLVKNGMQPFGHYEPGRLEDTCEVVGLPIRVAYSDKSERDATIPVAFCAWHYFYRMPLPGELEVLQQYAEVMPVFAWLHMGVEYKPAADALQRQVARRIIDLGAEVVAGNSPHWVQDAEAYNGKIILYSTGNFIFDQQYNAEVTRSASLDVIIKLVHDENVAAWLELGPQCTKYKDDCLSQAKAKGLKRIAPEFTYGVVAGDNSNKLTKKATPEIQRAVEDRLKWIAVPSQLSAPSE